MSRRLGCHLRGHPGLVPRHRHGRHGLRLLLLLGVDGSGVGRLRRHLLEQRVDVGLRHGARHQGRLHHGLDGASRDNRGHLELAGLAEALRLTENLRLRGYAWLRSGEDGLSGDRCHDGSGRWTLFTRRHARKGCDRFCVEEGRGERLGDLLDHPGGVQGSAGLEVGDKGSTGLQTTGQAGAFVNNLQ